MLNQPPVYFTLFLGGRGEGVNGYPVLDIRTKEEVPADLDLFFVWEGEGGTEVYIRKGSRETSTYIWTTNPSSNV